MSAMPTSPLIRMPYTVAACSYKQQAPKREESPMPTFRNPFTRKDSVRGSAPVDGRLAVAGLVTSSGDLAVSAGVLSGCTVTGRSTAPLWSYAVSAGHVVTTRGAGDGASLLGLDGATDTPTVAAAPATGSRWDLIWIQQRDVENADTDSNAVLGVTSGTSSGSPSKPYGSIPPGALVLAEAQVSAGAASTADALVVISQVAPRAAARGGLIPLRNANDETVLSVHASATNPLMGLRLDTGDVRRNLGSGWVTVAYQPRSWRTDRGTSGAVGTSTPFAAGPYTGMLDFSVSAPEGKYLILANIGLTSSAISQATVKLHRSTTTMIEISADVQTVGKRTAISYVYDHPGGALTFTMSALVATGSPQVLNGATTDITVVRVG